MRILSSGLSACLILLAPAPADALRAAGAGGAVIEVVTFRLLPGLDEAGFLDAARATRDALRAQPGFLRRSLARDASGLWTDLIEWQSLSQAHAAADAMMQDPAFGPFMAAIDPATIDMSHRPVIWQMD